MIVAIVMVALAILGPTLVALADYIHERRNPH